MSYALNYGDGVQDAINPEFLFDYFQGANAYIEVYDYQDGKLECQDCSFYGNEWGLTDTGWILLHQSLRKDGTLVYDALGKWQLVKVRYTSSSELQCLTTLDWIPDFTNYIVQAVNIPQFKSLTLSQPLTCDAYGSSAQGGGIIALMAQTLTLASNINLVGKGIPSALAEQRPQISPENMNPSDTEPFAGFENANALSNFPINVGDGICFLFAKKIVFNGSPRIGNPSTTGVAFNRGTSSGLIGGSGIFIAAQTIEGFDPKIIAKYGSGGKGYARAFIASETKLPLDEALYSYDCLHDSNRLAEMMNVTSYGEGTTDILNPVADVNIFARITAQDGQTLTYKDKTVNSTFAGQLVMVHFTAKTTTRTNYNGRFYLAKVLADDGSRLTLDTASPQTIPLAHYYCQVIRIPQYRNFTLNQTFSGTRAFDGSKGGLFAVAVSDTCDLRGGIIDMYGKGSGDLPAYGSEGMTIGNAHNHSRLPIGQGNGSIFILASKIISDSSTRLGNTSSGAGVSVYTGEVTLNSSTHGESLTGGSGKAGGTYAPSTGAAICQGGYGSNGDFAQVGDDTQHFRYGGGKQGAHLFIVADTWQGLTQAAIATGGCQYGSDRSNDGSASQGGLGTPDIHGNVSAGGFVGGGSGFRGGGSGGFAFFHVNQFT